MQWFSAHAVMYLKWLEGPQDKFVVLENVYLIRASDRAAAFDLALERARLEEVALGTSVVRNDARAGAVPNGRQARWCCAGIRKVIDVFHVSPENTLAHGDELTYTQLAFSREAEILAFAGGADMSVAVNEQWSEPQGTPRW
jgi:hypothetical protein